MKANFNMAKFIDNVLKNYVQKKLKGNRNYYQLMGYLYMYLTIIIYIHKTLGSSYFHNKLPIFNFVFSIVSELMQI